MAAVPLGAHPGGAGRFRVVLGKPGGFGCRGLFFKPGLFRFPQFDERGDVALRNPQRSGGG